MCVDKVSCGPELRESLLWGRRVDEASGKCSNTLVYSVDRARGPDFERMLGSNWFRSHKGRPFESHLALHC